MRVDGDAETDELFPGIEWSAVVEQALDDMRLSTKAREMGSKGAAQIMVESASGACEAEGPGTYIDQALTGIRALEPEGHRCFSCRFG